MEKLSGIYKITCLLNGVCYIGQSVDLTRRVRQHKTDLKNNRHHNKYLQNLFNKYKSDNFSFDVIELCDISQLDERERYWIAYYGGVESKANCNWESGGHHLKTYSQELRQVQSLSHKGQHSSPNTQFKKGRKPWNTGKKFSDEYRQKLSQVHLGKKQSKETKKKLSLVSKGKRLGKERYNAIPIACYDDLGNLIKRYECISQASKENCVSTTSISKAITKNKKCRGYYWKKDYGITI